MSKAGEFEKAILEFGVDAALEYFATPETEWHHFDELKAREKPSACSTCGGSGQEVPIGPHYSRMVKPDCPDCKGSGKGSGNA